LRDAVVALTRLTGRGAHLLERLSALACRAPLESAENPIWAWHAYGDRDAICRGYGLSPDAIVAPIRDMLIGTEPPSIYDTWARYALLGEEDVTLSIMTKLADAPVGDCDFERLRAVMGLDRIREAYRERGALDLEIYDLRRFAAPPGDLVYAHRRKSLAGDPAGSVIVDMGRDSALIGKRGPFFGADPSTSETNENHHGDVHRYSLSKTILSSDVLISLPKLKVHKRVGVTLNFKGFVGANTNKNYTMLIEVLAAVTAQAERAATPIPPPFLALVGDGPEATGIRAQIKRHGLERQCCLPGYGHAAEWYGLMDVMCLTSRTEGTALTLLEAGAAGLPSVVTAVGGNPEVVADGETGFVVPPGKTAPFIEALLRLGRDAGLRRRMGEAARRRIAARYGVDGMVSGYQAIYQSALSGSGSRGFSLFRRKNG